MSPEDFEIWRRWWPGQSIGALGLYFDVGLGLPDELPSSDSPSQLLGWIFNNQKRADVVVERVSSVDVIELRFNAGLNAVGRLRGYVLLLGEDNPFRKPIRGFLVSNRRDSEVGRLAADLGLFYEVA